MKISIKHIKSLASQFQGLQGHNIKRCVNMILIDVLTILDENKDCFVFHNGELISIYDGRDSIDEELNSRTVRSIVYKSNAHVIDIN